MKINSEMIGHNFHIQPGDKWAINGDFVTIYWNDGVVRTYHVTVGEDLDEVYIEQVHGMEPLSLETYYAGCAAIPEVDEDGYPYHDDY